MPDRLMSFASLLGRPFRRAGAFVRDERGVTAIELGILGVPFFVLVAAIMESALIFFASQVLDSSVQDASRHILTGEDQNAGFNLSKFKDEVCDGLYGLFDCSQLWANVTLVSDFSNANTGPVLAPDGSYLIPQNWSPGTGSQVVMVQVYYKWPTIFNFAGFNMANTPDGKARLLSAVRVFMNEPFT